MSKPLEFDICVIGAGAAGLSIAAGASQLGARAVLIEAGEMGGDCLNVGCVPSKALLAAAKAAHSGAEAAKFGITYAKPEVDFAGVMAHVKDVIAGIAPVDSQERFEGLGVTVIREWARFVDKDRVVAGEQEITAKRFVIATGSKPMVPPIEGLADVPFLTNETLFDLQEQPEHLIVMGGGPIGCELSQAFARLGTEVSIVEMASLLPKDDPEAADVVRQSLRKDGVSLHEGAKVTRVFSSVERAFKKGGVSVEVERQDGSTELLHGSHLLVAAGRTPSIQGLDLEKAGVDFHRAGVKVDAGLRTSNRKIYAVGDVAGGPQFTHVASYHASLFIRSFLFRLPAKTDYSALPWVTYSDPELAHVGLTEKMADDQGLTVQVLRWPFAENDRAQSERQTAGLLKAIVTPKGRILGCTIVGAHAGEAIYPWVLALHKKLSVKDMVGMIAPYPTFGEVTKRATGAFYTPKLFSERTKWLVRLLLKLG